MRTAIHAFLVLLLLALSVEGTNKKDGQYKKKWDRKRKKVATTDVPVPTKKPTRIKDSPQIHMVSRQKQVDNARGKVDHQNKRAYRKRKQESDSATATVSKKPVEPHRVSSKMRTQHGHQRRKRKPPSTVKNTKGRAGLNAQQRKKKTGSTQQIKKKKKTNVGGAAKPSGKPRPKQVSAAKDVSKFTVESSSTKTNTMKKKAMRNKLTPTYFPTYFPTQSSWTNPINRVPAESQNIPSNNNNNNNNNSNNNNNNNPGGFIPYTPTYYPTTFMPTSSPTFRDEWGQAYKGPLPKYVYVPGSVSSWGKSGKNYDPGYLVPYVPPVTYPPTTFMPTTFPPTKDPDIIRNPNKIPTYMPTYFPTTSYPTFSPVWDGSLGWKSAWSPPWSPSGGTPTWKAPSGWPPSGSVKSNEKNGWSTPTWNGPPGWSPGWSPGLSPGQSGKSGKISKIGKIGKSNGEGNGKSGKGYRGGSGGGPPTWNAPSWQSQTRQSPTWRASTWQGSGKPPKDKDNWWGYP